MTECKTCGDTGKIQPDGPKRHYTDQVSLPPCPDCKPKDVWAEAGRAAARDTKAIGKLMGFDCKPKCKTCGGDGVELGEKHCSVCKVLARQCKPNGVCEIEGCTTEVKQTWRYCRKHGDK